MRALADEGLATPVNDVWDVLGDDVAPGIKATCSSITDSNQYLVPYYFYPWGVFYRKSIFEDRNYTVPETLDQWVSLADKMKSDGLTPIAFGAADGWPQMGTFDYINMRVNGYDFHQSLMIGEESWESSEVRETFKVWTDLLPLHQDGPTGRTWQEAAQSIFGDEPECGMYVLNTLGMGQQAAESDQEGALEDLDFFAFPEINPEHGRKAVEAPIDGFMLSKDQADNQAAKDLLAYLGQPEAQDLYISADPSNLGTHDGTDTSVYNALQQKAVEIIKTSENVSQFLDRDSKPAFVSEVVIPQFGEFLSNPGNIDSILKNMEAQKVEIFSN